MLDIDITAFELWTENTERLAKVDIDKFCRDVSNELTLRLLRKVIKRTNVGKNVDMEIATIDKSGNKVAYKSGKHKGQLKTKTISLHKGGTLRRGWQAHLAKELPIKKVGNAYEITVINPVKYASYVEFGHRQTPGRYVPALGKSLKKSWVVGRFWLTKSEAEIAEIAPRLIEQRLKEVLEGVF